MTPNTIVSEEKEGNVSAIEEHEKDYRRRVERLEFTRGLSREELMRKINTPKSSKSN